jgi:hypothetical protein
MPLRGLDNFSPEGVHYGPSPYPETPTAGLEPIVQPPTEVPTATPTGGASPYDELFAAKEKEYKLPPGMLRALSSQESSSNPSAMGVPITSEGSAHTGDRAMGLFQFMPKTWEGEGHIGDPLNPVDATEAAAKKLNKSFKSRGTIGGALEDWYGRGTAPPGHPTTKEFMDGVLGRMNEYAQQSAPQSRVVEDTRGDFGRGWSDAWRAIPASTYGVISGVGALGETAFGEGGMSTDIKKYGVEGAVLSAHESAQNSKTSDDLNYSWDRAKEGDLDSLVDWFQYAIGHSVANLTQIAATYAGSAILAPAAVGALGVTGLTVVARRMLAPTLAKEAIKLAKKKNSPITDAIKKEAVKNVTRKIGGYTGIAGFSGGMAGGEIGGDVATKSEKRGTPVTGAEHARALAATGASASLDFVGNVLGFKALRGKLGGGISKIAEAPGIKGKVGRIGLGSAKAAPVEGVTESLQTYIEEWGKGNPISGETHDAAFNAFGLGFVGGTTAATIGGALSGPMKAEESAPLQVGYDKPPPLGLPPPSPVEPPATYRAPLQIGHSEPTRDPNTMAVGPDGMAGDPAAVATAIELEKQRASGTVADRVQTMMRSIFPAFKSKRMARDYIAALQGNTEARDRVLDAILAQQDVRKVGNAEQAVAALDDGVLARELKDEAVRDYDTQAEVTNPDGPAVGQVEDMFGGVTRFPDSTENFWDLISSEQNPRYNEQGFADRAQELEGRYNEAVAAGDTQAAEGIRSLALDDLADIFWDHNNTNLAEDSQKSVTAIYEKELTEYEREHREYQRQYEIAQRQRKQGKVKQIEGKVKKANKAWDQRFEELKGRAERAMAGNPTAEDALNGANWVNDQRRKIPTNRPALQLSGGLRRPRSYAKRPNILAEQSATARASEEAALTQRIKELEARAEELTAQVEEAQKKRYEAVKGSKEKIPNRIMLAAKRAEAAAVRAEKVAAMLKRQSIAERRAEELAKAKEAKGRKDRIGTPETTRKKEEAAKARKEKREANKAKKRNRAKVTTGAADEPAASRVEGESDGSSGISMAKVKSIVDTIKAQWKNAPPVVVVANMSSGGVPTAIKDAAEEWKAKRAREGESTNFVERGVFYDGTVYLFADNITTSRGVVETLYHESLGHFGLRGVFGTALDEVLESVVRLRGDDVAAKGAEYKFNMDTKKGRLRAAEEVLAEMAQTNPQLSFVRRAVSAIRTWLRKNLPSLFGSMRLTNDEIIANYLMPAREFVRRGNSKGKVGGKTDISFSIVDTTAKVGKTATAWGRKVDEEGIVRELGTKLTDFALTYLSTLGQFVKQAKKVLPSVRGFDKYIRQMSAFANSVSHNTNKVATKWGALIESDPEQSKKLEDYITATDAWRIRGDQEKDSPANKQAFDALVAEDAENAAKVYADMKAMWAGLSKPAQEVYTEQARLSTEMINSVVGAMVNQIRDSIPNSERAAEMIAMLESKWAAARAGQAWAPHKRHGQWIVVVTGNAGQREVYGYETEVQADNAKAIHEERFADFEPKVVIFKASEMVDNLDKADVAIINKIKKAVVSGVTDPAEARKVEAAVQEIYIAALPEMAGAKRMMARKNVPGWDTNYRRSWSEAMVSMGRYSAKLKFMNKIRDAVLDAGREAGKVNTVYAVTYWDDSLDDPKLTTKFFNRALEKNKFVSSLGEEDGNMVYDLSEDRPSTILNLVKSTYHTELGVDKGDVAFKDVEQVFKTDEGAKALAPHPDSKLSSRYLNILRHRYGSLLESRPRGPISNALLNVGFVNYLGWTPAFAFMNITQVPMLTFPRLAARYGQSNAIDAIGRGYKFTAANRKVFTHLMTAAWSKGGLDALQIDDFKNEDGTPLTAERAELLQYLLDHGKLDFTQGSELNALSDNTNQFVQRVVKSSSWLAHPTEVLNRVVTALAAYELAYEKTSPALSKSKRRESARDVAIEVLDNTQYDYAAENRPLALNNPLFRVALQFRQFAQQTAWQLGLAVKEALSKQDSEQRREQRAYLAYMFTTTLAFAGVRGLPAAGTVMLILSMLGDEEDDVEFDIEKDMRGFLGDGLGAMVSGGVFNLFGIDAAANIGYGDIIPGTNSSNRVSTEGKDKLKNFVYDALGPTAAFAGSVMTGLDTIEKGDYQRGLEESLPKAFRTPLKAYRLSDRGWETKAGVVRLKNTDITPWEIAVTAMGLKPTRLGWVQRQVNVVQSTADALRFQSSILRKRLQFATTYNDRKEIAVVRKRIKEFGIKYPDFKMSAASLSNRGLLAKQRKADDTGGVATTRAEINLYNMIMEDELDF